MQGCPRLHFFIAYTGSTRGDFYSAITADPSGSIYAGGAEIEGDNLYWNWIIRSNAGH